MTSTTTMTTSTIVALLREETLQSQVATVMVTHDHEVLGHCDRVFEMHDGRLSAA